MLTRSLRDTALATLMFFSSGCFFQCGSYQTNQPQYQNRSPQRPSSSKPKPAKPKPSTNRPKPSQPRPPSTQPRPTQPKPETRPPANPRPKPGPRPGRPTPDVPKNTQIVVPVRVAFNEAVQQIDAKIQRTMTQDWQVVSEKGAAVQIEARYKVWRDPIEARFDNGTLKVEVPVRYAADVRASANNPLGGGRIWITKGVTWGTARDPQKLRAKFHAEFDIREDFSVTADAGLDDIDFGPAPTGDVCVKSKLVQFCMSKEKAAPMVHKNLEGQLVPRIKKAIGEADKQLEKQLRLKKQAEQLWSLLQRPQLLQKPGQANCPSVAGSLCTTSGWLVARPTSIGVSKPRMDGKDLRVDLGIGGDLSVTLGDEPKTNPTALPKLRDTTGAPGFAVRAKVRIPLSILSEEINNYLKGRHIGGRGTAGFDVTKVTIVDGFDREHPNRIRLAISVRGAMSATLEVQGDLVWNTRQGELSVQNVEYTLDTNNAQLKKLSADNHAAMLRLISEKARWKIGTKTASLGQAITRALGNVWRGHLSVSGELSKVDLEDFSMSRGALTADVVIGGQLGVSFTP